MRRIFGGAGQSFGNSRAYWEERYRRGGDSGKGSYGRLAAYKADVLNAFVAEKSIHSLIEFGCGDGAQLSLALYPNYVGLDVSPMAIALCRSRFARDGSKSFILDEGDAAERLAPAELTLSLDVIYHLIEDEVFERYMRNLFDKARRYVAIYADDGTIKDSAAHVRSRAFSAWIEEHRPEWVLDRVLDNPFAPNAARAGADPVTPCRFFFYARKT